MKTLYGWALVLILALCIVSACGSVAAPPVKCGVIRLDDVLRPEGGTARLALVCVKQSMDPLATTGLTLTPTFADVEGRVFWEGPPVAVVVGDAKAPGRVEVAVSYPPLPAGGYKFRGIVRNAAGVQVTEVEALLGRPERFDFQRHDLVWLAWASGTPAWIRTARDLGINGLIDMDPRAPYPWFKSSIGLTPEERYPEDVVRHPQGTAMEYVQYCANSLRPLGGAVLYSLTDEVPENSKAPAMHAARLRLARVDPWMNVPTLSRFNAYFQTDFLSWDEIFREGFPPLNHPQYGANPIAWTADRAFRDVETPMMMTEFFRQATPGMLSTPGATHCLVDTWADSFNSRAYNNNPTLMFLDQFISAQPAYGLRPGNKLINLKPARLGSAFTPYWEGHEHLYWAALATNNRMFMMYVPGDSYGAQVATPDGLATPEGTGFQAIHHVIHPLRPTILTTRSRVNPAVVSLAHGWNDGGRNLMDGALANGILMTGTGTPGPEAKLIFALGADATDAVLAQVRAGAGLVCNGDQAALGIALSGSAPAPAWQEIDLTPLAKAFPGLAGVKVMGAYGGDVRVTAGNGLEEVRAGDKLLAVTGPLGRGWVLYLNVTLQDMSRDNDYGGGGWHASNLSLLVDGSIPDRNAALMRALLARAGVPERVRVTDRAGRVAPQVRAFPAESYDGAQQYLFLVSEALGKMEQDPADPKKAMMVLASDNPLTGTIRIFDPAVKAIRDLRTGTLLPVRTDAQGIAADYRLVPGQGTLLALLTAPPAGGLTLRLSQPDVAGSEAVQVEVSRRGADGTLLALPGHALWVRFLDPQGREVEALTRWATGGGPHVFTAQFALNDPAGEWTVVAEDQTDGTRTEMKLRRQGKAAGPRLAFTPNSPLVRGAATPGVLRVTNPGAAPLSLEGVTLACATKGVRVTAQGMKASVPAGGTADVPVSVEVDPAAPDGPGLLTLRRGEALLGGARFDVPAPYTVTLDATPYLDGDLILTEIRGTLRCSAAGPTPITLRLPANPAGAAREVTVTSPRAYVEVPFALPLWMTRAQAQALCTQRHDGVDLTVTAPGLPGSRVNYCPNILPLARAPQRIGAQAGGKLAVKVNNFTGAAQRVAVTVAPLPGEDGKPWQADAAVPPGASAVFGRTVAGLPALDDPGLYNLALDWTVGGAAQARAALPVDALYEQEWWVKAIDQMNNQDVQDMEDEAILLEELKGQNAPALPATAADRAQAGWRRVSSEGVVWWRQVAPPQFGFGRILVATEVHAPRSTRVRVSAIGLTPPGLVWVNGGTLAAVGPTAAPVTLRQGRNEIILALEVTGKNNPLIDKTKKGETPILPGYALALLDPVTGKRDRTLRIGTPLDAEGTASGHGASPQPSVVIEPVEVPRPVPATSGAAVEWYNPDAFEPDPMALVADHDQEWWIKTIDQQAAIDAMDPDGGSGTAIEDVATLPDTAPVFPGKAQARNEAGWHRIVTRGELHWPSLAPTLTLGRMYALTHVDAPAACTVRVALGRLSMTVMPGLVWVNGVRVGAAPVSLHAGLNTVVLALDVKGKKSLTVEPPGRPTNWLVLLDPESGKRVKTLNIGAPAPGDQGRDK